MAPASPQEAEPEAYVVHYELTIDPDLGSGHISLTALLDVANPDAAPELWLGLNSAYEVVSLSLAGEPATIEREDEGLRVDLFGAPDRFRLEFEIAGTPGTSDAEGREVVTDSSLFLLWSDRFYPVAFDDWATVTTRLLLPRGFEAIAPGRSEGRESLADGRQEHVFRSSRRLNLFSVFADARWIRTERELDGLSMQTLLHPESQRFADQIFETSRDVISFYEGLYSVYPFDSFSFVTIPDIYARRAFPGWVGYSPDYLEREMTTTGHDAHETALLWWFYTIRGTGPGAWQWTEGFGDYAELLYDEERGLPIPRVFQIFRDRYLEMDREADRTYDELGGASQAIVHGKYPWLMHLLRFAVGDAAFSRAMRAAFEDFSGRVFSMDEYIAILEEATGQELEWWRVEWLQRKGVPSLRYDTRVQEHGRGYRLTVSIEQLGEFYELPLEVGIETASGKRIERVELKEARQSWEYDLTEVPVAVTLDPNGWILMNVVRR